MKTKQVHLAPADLCCPGFYPGRNTAQTAGTSHLQGRAGRAGRGLYNWLMRANTGRRPPLTPFLNPPVGLPMVQLCISHLLSSFSTMIFVTMKQLTTLKSSMEKAKFWPKSSTHLLSLAPSFASDSGLFYTSHPEVLVLYTCLAPLPTNKG